MFIDFVKNEKGKKYIPTTNRHQGRPPRRGSSARLSVGQLPQPPRHRYPVRDLTAAPSGLVGAHRALAPSLNGGSSPLTPPLHGRARRLPRPSCRRSMAGSSPPGLRAASPLRKPADLDVQEK
jgi:hypothetical protein